MQPEPLFLFSLDLYAQLVLQNTNNSIVCSPFSVATMLSMLLAGARGNTAEELSRLLRVWDGDGIRRQISDFLGGISREPAVLRVANRLYSASRFSVRTAYAQLLAGSYGAEIESVDFARDHRAIRREANEWVSRVTGSRIRHALFPGSIDAYTTLTVLSVAHLQAPWLLRFDQRRTRIGDFYERRYRRTEVDMMHVVNDFKTGRSEELGCSALEMAYKGGRYSMVILLPDQVDGLSALEERMTPYSLDSLLVGLTMESRVQLSLPRFKVDRHLFLHRILKGLGVNDLFAEGSADLSGIFDNASPAVSIVVQQASVQVDEDGTGAPAAKASIASPAFRSLSPNNFTVDHPFMFVIKTNLEDMILFMGSVRKPQ